MAQCFVERRSPNHDARPEGAKVDILVLHYTGMRSAEDALARLCDSQAKVSAHYTIDRDGCIYRHVEEDRRARHAGVSYWAGERDVNGRSIGIELVNPGHEWGYVGFTEEQIAALIELARGILARHPISPQRVLGHSDVAPARKIDPGELFPWAQLADSGIGLWPAYTPKEVGVTDASNSQTFAKGLVKYGYGIRPDVDVPLATAVTAFQRHFRPAKIDGIVDAETGQRLSALLATLE